MKTLFKYTHTTCRLYTNGGKCLVNGSTDGEESKCICGPFENAKEKCNEYREMTLIRQTDDEVALGWRDQIVEFINSVVKGKFYVSVCKHVPIGLPVVLISISSDDSKYDAEITVTVDDKVTVQTNANHGYNIIYPKPLPTIYPIDRLFAKLVYDEYVSERFSTLCMSFVKK